MKLVAPLPREAHRRGPIVVSHRLGGSQLLIEGSWQRIHPDLSVRPMAKASRTAMLVWAAVSLAGLGGGASVYVHGGLETQMTAHAAVAGTTAQAEPESRTASVPAVAARAAVPGRNPAGPPSSAERTTGTYLPSMLVEATAANQQAASEPATLVAAPPSRAPAPRANDAAPTLDSSNVSTPLQARLPRPRPEPRIAFASIERRWDEVRALRNPARYPVIRPRFVHRYRLPPP